MRKTPKKTKVKKKVSTLNGVKLFLDAISELRHPKRGCPWDLEQTHESLTKYLIEESFEYIHALETNGISNPHTAEELSDVLLQIGLHAHMASENGYFNFDSLAQIAAQKIKDRHPHVFDPTFPKFKTAAEVNKAWESIKARMKKANTGSPSRAQEPPISSSLTSIPRALPALQRAHRLGEKMSSFGFDWPNTEQCFEKITEEIKELKEATSPEHLQEEWGDLAFALSQWARLKGWDPEALLHRANEKFISRSTAMESLAQKDGKRFSNLASLEEKERYWEKAKKQIKTKS